jgi:hypothetical protein
MLRLLMGCVGVFLLVPGPIAARERHVKEVLEAVQDAMDEIDSADRACRRAVREDLEELEGGLKRLSRDFDRRKAHKLLRELEDLRDDAKDKCPRGVDRALRDAVEALEDATEKGHGAHGDGEAAPPPPVDCWNGSDPGCLRTKGGQPPMGKVAFEGFLQTVRAQKPHVFPMKDAMEAALQNATLTSQQLSVIIEEFKPHSQVMLDVIKLAAPRLVDPQNGAGVSAKLAPHTFLVQEAAEAISAQRGD